MDEALLDTDILSEVIKAKDASLLVKAREYLAQYQRFAFSAMSVYEITRGFRATGTVRQLADFLKLADDCEVVAISTPILDQASHLWADAHVAGHPRDDADLIIAATALETRRVLVTGNVSHFTWIPQLRVENWRQP